MSSMTPFDPSIAAGNAGAFAGILAAIVLAVLGQLAVTEARQARNEGTESSQATRRYELSLVLGVPLLLALIADTYMFVLLSGTHQDGPVTAHLGNLRTAAFAFTVSGSLLAVCAAAAMVFIRIVLAESTSFQDTATSASTAVMAVGVAVTAVFLTYGYGDIWAAFRGEYFSPGRWISMFAITAGTALVLLASPRRLLPRWLKIDTHSFKDAMQANQMRLAFIIALVSLYAIMLPAIGFLIASKHAFKSCRAAYSDGAVNWVFFAAAAWTGSLLGLLVIFLRANERAAPATE